MSKCDLCQKCTPKRCPKSLYDKSKSSVNLSVSRSTYNELEKLCKKKKLFKGQEYYQVADIETAIKFLLKNR